VLVDRTEGRLFVPAFAAVAAFLAVVPLFAGLFYQTFLTELFVFAMFAVAFDLLFGYAGLLSFGQALFFGLGGYAVAISILRLGAGTAAALLLSVAVPVAFAAFVGYFSVRLSGIHFVIITIIFALIASTLGETWTWLTGGADGLVFSPPPLDLGVVRLDLSDVRTTYYLVLVVTAASFLVVRRLVMSPFGGVLVAIRENEERARLIGYDVRRYKLAAFVAAGGLSGLAGGLYSLSLKYASASFLHWSVSGHAVVYTVVGGGGTLVGPVLGASLLMSLEHALADVMQASDLVVGAVLVLTLLLLPRGIVGSLRGRRG